MGLAKQYLRYGPAGLCNVIASTSSNLAVVDQNICVVAACHDIYFWNLRKIEKLTHIRGDKQVLVLEFSPNRRYLAVGYADGNVKIFDRKAASDDPVVIFSGHRTGVNCLAFSNDGLLLASGGKDNVIIVWDIVNECGLFRLNGHKGALTHLQFARGTKYLISSSKDTLIKFWDLSTQSCFYTLTDHRTEVYDFVLLKNDSQLISGSVELELGVFALTWLREISQSDVIDLSSDVKRLRTESLAEEDQQANTIVRCEKQGSLLRQTKGRVTSLSISEDHSLLLCVGTGNSMDIFRIYSKEEIQKRVQKKIRKARKRAAQADEGISDSLEMEVPKDLSTQISRVGQHKCDAKIKSPTFLMNSSDGTIYKVLLLLSNNSLEWIDLNFLKSGEFMSESVGKLLSPGHRTDIRTLTFSHDDFAILSGSQDSVKLWNRHSMTCVQTIECQDVLSALFVTGDRHAVVGTKSGELFLVDLSSAEILEKFDAHEASIWTVSLRPDMKGFLSASADKTVKLWNFELISENERKRLSLSHVRTLELSDDVLCARYSQNQKFIAVGLLDNTAKVFFSDNLKFFLSLYGHSLPVLCLDISYDNSLIITGSADKNIKIWGMDFGDCHRSLFAHDDSVTCVQFVQKSHLFFSAGKDGSIKQWDADKFEKIQTLQGHDSQIWALSISSTGRFLASASHDKSLRLWEKTEEILVLQEEQEIEREKEYEQSLADKDDVIAGETADNEAGLAAKKTIESVKSAENILEAIDICRQETIAIKEEPEHSPHPLIISFGSSDLDRFVLDVLKRIRSSNLEKCLLLVPFGYVLEILKALTVCVNCGYQLELASRIIMFLTRIHHNQLINSSDALPILDKLRCVMPAKIAKTRDMIGFNQAALQLLQLEIEDKNEIQLFAEASEKLHKKKKKKKQQTFLMSVV